MPSINTRIYITTNPNDLYYDSDNHVQIDMVAYLKDSETNEEAFDGTFNTASEPFK